jgi:hypothetical protein
MFMILVDLVPGFPGKANQTRCFAHILNLIAKTIIKQFDTPERNGNDEMSDDERLLVDLADGIELEEIDTRLSAKDDAGDAGNAGDDDNEDGWVDEVEELSEEEKRSLDSELVPVHLVIAKVSVLTLIGGDQRT